MSRHLTVYNKALFFCLVDVHLQINPYLHWSFSLLEHTVGYCLLLLSETQARCVDSSPCSCSRFFLVLIQFPASDGGHVSFLLEASSCCSFSLWKVTFYLFHCVPFFSDLFYSRLSLCCCDDPVSARGSIVSSDQIRTSREVTEGIQSEPVVERLCRLNQTPAVM